jgi:hypothetical protein
LVRGAEIYTCKKKGNSYGVVMVDAEKTHFEADDHENDGRCKCGTGCGTTAPAATEAPRVLLLSCAANGCGY